MTGVCWIPPKKDTQCPRAKEKPQQDSRRGAIAFRIKSQTHQRCSEGANKTLCTPGPRERISYPIKRLGQTCLRVFECLLRRQESAVACQKDRGSGCSRPGCRGVWPKSSWRKSPLAPPQRHRADDPQTRTITPKKSSHCCKSSKAHNRFPKLGIQPKG